MLGADSFTYTQGSLQEETNHAVRIHYTSGWVYGMAAIVVTRFTDAPVSYWTYQSYLKPKNLGKVILLSEPMDKSSQS
jgi:hypothetical protein